MEESPPFKYEIQSVDDRLVASVSNVLDIAGIPSVLWGEILMNVHGVPLVLQDFELIVPGEDLDRAYQVLQERGFLTCQTGQDCKRSPESDVIRFYPAAPRHLHLDEHGGVGLLLHKKSETLWTVFSFEPFSLEKNPEAKIILASDPDGVPQPDSLRGSGVFPENLFPVRIPSAHCLMEAYVLLAERDFDENYHGRNRPITLLYDWHRMILLMIKYGGWHPHPLNLEYIDPRCRELYRYFKNEETWESREKLFGSELDVMRRLRKSMEESR